jgi:hypothetical protein
MGYARISSKNKSINLSLRAGLRAFTLNMSMKCLKGDEASRKTSAEYAERQGRNDKDESDRERERDGGYRAPRALKDESERERGNGIAGYDVGRLNC